MRDRLLVTGLVLLGLSLAISLSGQLLLRLDRGGSLTSLDVALFALVGWAQQAALVVGAALVAASLVLRRLQPAGVPPEPGEGQPPDSTSSASTIV